MGLKLTGRLLIQVKNGINFLGTLNAWLKVNGGYAQGNLFVWPSVNVLGLPWYNFITVALLGDNLAAGRHCILNVNNGRHWVLATSVEGNTAYVNDAYYDVDSYDLSGVGRIGCYNPIKTTLLE